MAASRKNSRSRKTGSAAASRKKTGKSSSAKEKVSVSGGFRREILLIVIFGVAVLLMIANLGYDGFLGNAVSTFSFGVFGLMSYVFPVALFMGAAFYLSNKGNILAVKKLAAGSVFFFFACGMAQMMTEGYITERTLLEYFQISSRYHTGGGIIGAALSVSCNLAFGLAGTYVIMILVMIIMLILITQRSFFGFLWKLFGFLGRTVRSGVDKVKENTPDKEQRSLLREQKRIKKQEAAREAAAKRKETRSDLSPEGFMEGTDLLQEERGKKAVQKTEKEEKDRKEKKRSFKIYRGEIEEEDSFIDPKSAKMPKQEEAVIGEENDFEEAAVSLEQPSSKTGKNPKSSQEEIHAGIERIQEEITLQEVKEKAYEKPPLSLLKKGKKVKNGDSDEHLRSTAEKLETTLHNFGVNVTVTNASCGPTVTRYEVQPEQGVKVSKIVNLADDIKLNLAAADVRIEAPIPGKAAVGIEVPNATNSPVMLRDVLQSDSFQQSTSKLTFAVGKDVDANVVVADIAKMPHLLIAGSTGSGKSVCINTLIMSILYKSSPEEVKLIMVDPKVVELSVYNGIPHLLIPVVTDPKKAAGALNWAVQEMTSRYNAFAEYNVRNLADYNKKIESMKPGEGEEKPAKMPQIVIIVDELADLMMVAPGEVEDAICRLAQLARAAGIHLIIATQRPSVNVITGLIKANMPSRIAFAVSSGVDSRTILDSNGAEKLLGKGDMLFYPQGYQKALRVQGAFVSDEEVSSVVHFLENQKLATGYSAKIEEQISAVVLSGSLTGASSDDRDVYFAEAGKFIIEKEKASIGMLQRMFKIGFNRAARIMDQLAEAGVVGPEEGTKPRKVLMSMEEFERYIEE